MKGQMWAKINPMLSWEMSLIVRPVGLILAMNGEHVQSHKKSEQNGATQNLQEIQYHQGRLAHENLRQTKYQKIVVRTNNAIVQNGPQTKKCNAIRQDAAHKDKIYMDHAIQKIAILEEHNP